MNKLLSTAAVITAAGIATASNGQSCETILNTGLIDVTQGGVSCADTGVTTDNFFAKSYDLSTLLPGQDLFVSCIEFGAGHTGTLAIPLEIAIYTDTNGGAPTAPGIDMVEVPGSRIVTQLQPGPDGLLQVSYANPIQLPADGTYVVEMFLGAATDGFASVGSNTGPDANDTYIRADDCGLANYVTYASIGFPTQFWAQQLIGSTTPGSCDCYTGSDCFVARPAESGCDDPICESLVCAFDDFCCTDSWDDTCAGLADAFCNFTGFECDLPAATGSEAETCGADTNGGCNMDIPAFETIASGDIIAGTYYVDATADIRDTDWYQFTIDQVSNVTWTVNSRVAVDTLIVTTDCVAGAQVIASGNGECPSTVQICLQPGTYAAFVAANTGGGNLPCDLTDFTAYTGELTVEPLEACPGFDVCEAGDLGISPNTDLALGTGGIACAAAGITTENTYAVTIDLAASDAAGTDINVSCVTFGSDNSGSLVNARVELWIDNDGGDPVAPGTDLTLLGTRDTVLAQGVSNLQTAKFDPPICVPADSQLVVTIFIEPSTDGFATFSGNAAQSSSSTYVLSDSCGLTTFTKLEDIGFPDVNWVVDVESTLGCGGGNDCPGDFNDDGVVNGADFGAILAAWGPTTGPEDLDGDGQVSGADVGLLLSVWGPCP